MGDLMTQVGVYPWYKLFYLRIGTVISSLLQFPANNLLRLAATPWQVQLCFK